MGILGQYDWLKAYWYRQLAMSSVTCDSFQPQSLEL